MGVLKRVVKLSRADFKTLTDKGTVTVDGQTIEYSDDDIYVVPNIEIDHSQYVDISSNQVIKGVKTFKDSIGTVRLGFNGSVEVADTNSCCTLIYGSSIQNIGDSGYMDISYNTGISVYDMLNGTSSILKLPMGKSGTLATTDDCKKLYKHSITLSDQGWKKVLMLHLITSKSTMYAVPNELAGNAGAVIGTFARYQDSTTNTEKWVHIIGVSYGSITTTALLVVAQGITDNSSEYIEFSNISDTSVVEL